MIVGPSRAHLTYCTNIHPGESWPEVFASLREHVPAVKARVSPSGRFGLGLRLSAEAAEGLEDARELDAFRDFLEAEGLYVFTINGFPYGRFHGDVVKERVYRPDWREDARLEYTNRLATLLAALLPDDGRTTGSISTVPGAFEARVGTPGDAEEIVDRLVAHAAHLASIERRTGKLVRLALEPEPHCHLETIAETVTFFHELVFGHRACAKLASDLAIPLDEADRVLRRHLGVCLDACHLAVEFDDPREAVAALARARIGVFKIQLTAGLAATFPAAPEGRAAVLDALARFVEPTYLHQVVARRGSMFVRHLDLPDALAGADAESCAEGDEWRVHFHVPLFHGEMGAFHSTRGYVKDLLSAFGTAGLANAHLEVETYTWDVLPEEHRPGSVVDGIARELGWVAEQREELGR